MGIFKKLEKLAISNGHPKEELPNFDQPGAFVKWFTGGGDGDAGTNDIEMLQIVERHGSKINTRQNVGLTSLMLLNQQYDDPIITEFVENWMYLRVHSKEAARDVNKAIEHIYNKRFTENINTSMKLGGR